MRQIGKDLGVRYALEGSVQPSGDRLRVNAQLMDTESDAHLWADQFDENRSDLLQMQDAIVTRIAFAIGIKITERKPAGQKLALPIPMRKTLLGAAQRHLCNGLDARTRFRLSPVRASVGDRP